MKIHLGSVLVCLLVSSVTGDPAGGVSFWQTNFTMTCPGIGDWFQIQGEGSKPVRNQSQIFPVEYNDNTKGHYYCVYTDKVEDTEYKYHFFVRGKVCANCYELDTFLVPVVIVADIGLTMGVILLVYNWTRRRRAPAATRKKVSSSGPGGGPPTPSPDYEVLNANTRSDPYASVHRMG